MSQMFLSEKKFGPVISLFLRDIGTSLVACQIWPAPPPVMADTSAALAVVAVGLLFLLLGGLVWVTSRATAVSDASHAKLKAEAGAVAIEDGAAVGRRASRVRGGARRRRNRAGGEAEDDGDEGDVVPPLDDPREAARRAQQQAQAQELETLHKKRAGREAKYLAKDLAREATELAEREQADKERAEAEKASAEEFDKWKDLFTVETSGTVEQTTAEDSAGLLQDFVDHIVQKKVVVLEELAAEFGLRTRDAVQRVRSLEQMGKITGVMDDRGKFIFVTPGEMSEVANFINRKGRVAISELAARSSDFVKL